MRDRSNTWISLASRGEFEIEAKAVIGGVEYTAITAPVIDRGLFASEALSVGNCIAASAEFTVMTTDSIPKSAQVVIIGRLKNGSTTSEWKEFGTFWINQRHTDDDLITLECFDAMLKANQAYVDDSDPTGRIGWPKSMQACVSEIAQRMGVSIDSRTTIKTTSPYVVPYPSKLTMLQVLGYIGGCHGGNWIITPEGKLRLVPLVSPPAETFDIIDYDYNRIKTEDGDKLVWQHIQTQEVVQQRAGGGLINVPVVLGEITTGRQYTISRVTMTVDADLGYTAGTSTGYELQIEDNPYAKQAICDDLLGELNGISYVPFFISSACYDPMAELGDWILVGDKVRSVLCSETITMDINYRVDASAPGDDEVGSEYPYLTVIERLKMEDERLQKYIEDSVVEINSSISQTRTSILLTVSQTYATTETLNTQISLVNGAINLKVDASGVIAAINASVEQSGGSAVKISADKVNLTGYVTMTNLSTAGQTTINGSNITTGIIKDANSNTTFNLSNGQLDIKSGSINLGSGNFIVNSSGNVTIKSGSINLGNGKFVVDSSGNLTATAATITGTIKNSTQVNMGAYYATALTKFEDGQMQFFLDGVKVGYISVTDASNFAFSGNNKDVILTRGPTSAQVCLEYSNIRFVSPYIIVQRSWNDLPAYGYTGTISVMNENGIIQDIEIINGIVIG